MLHVEDPALALALARPLEHGRSERSSPRRGAYFIRGPIPFDWFAAAARLPGKALHVGMMLWFYVGLKKSRRLKFPLTRLIQFGMDRSRASRGLKALERSGLVRVVRGSGRSPEVTVLDVGPPEQ